MNFLNILWLLPLGYGIGLVVNYISDYLPYDRRLGHRPYCLKCKQTFDLFDYITFKQCSMCNSGRSLRSKLVPILSTIVMIALFFYPPEITKWWIAALVFIYFAIIFIIDMEHRLILHPTSIAGIFLAGGVGFIFNGFIPTLIGGVAGFGLMYLLYLFGLLFAKWMSKIRGQELSEVALGYGDVNLSGVVGLLVGWPRIWIVLVLAIFFGGVVSAIILLIMALRKKYSAFTPIPYAPFIILAASFIFYIATPK